MNTHVPCVLVCGGRKFQDKKLVFRTLSRILRESGNYEIIIVTGGATGADELAMHWAHTNEQIYITFPARWKKYGKSAGPIRNGDMLHKCLITRVVAFPGGSGTANMVQQARKHGTPVQIVKANPI